ncbi:MAG: 4Fe-4S dicluster domain-containing protein [Bacteroidetes bacterium]|nr:MAG: 4Fe-4S dicluster domain-containing protein [Bacteroidota bacterium]
MEKHTTGKIETANRREFLKKGATTAAAAVMASTLFGCDDGDVKETGEVVELLSQDGEIVVIDKAYLKEIPFISPMEARQGIENRKFVMVIDLARCNNARKCVDACSAMHYLTPEKEWLKVVKMQDNDLGAPYWQPTLCFHCDHPPCVKVCPVDATYKRTDGIVLIDNERCVGCRFCMVACPYSARVFDWSEPILPLEVANQPYSPETSCPPKIGTVSKCDFCPDMIRAGKLPSCIDACPNGVFYFGDENEDSVTNGTETVSLTGLLKDKSGYRFLEDLGTKPRVYFLPPVDRQFKFEDDEYTKDSAHE